MDDRETFRESLVRVYDLADWAEKELPDRELLDSMVNTAPGMVLAGDLFPAYHWQRDEVFRAFPRDVWRWASNYAGGWEFAGLFEMLGSEGIALLLDTPEAFMDFMVTVALIEIAYQTADELEVAGG